MGREEPTAIRSMAHTATAAAAIATRLPERICCAPKPASIAIPSENAGSTYSAYSGSFTAYGSMRKIVRPTGVCSPSIQNRKAPVN